MHNHYQHHHPTINSINQSTPPPQTSKTKHNHLPTNHPPTKMPTSHISTPLAGVDAAIVIKALHNHDLMIKTLCPALVSYHFESGDKNTSATYSITDRKPIGQVSYINSDKTHNPRSFVTNTFCPDNLQTHADQRLRRRRLTRQRQTPGWRAYDFGKVEGYRRLVG
jgi:hypothetical protein